MERPKQLFTQYIILLLWAAITILIQTYSAENGVFILQSYFEDVNGKYTIDSVQKMKFEGFERSLSKSYTSSVYWIKIDIKDQVEKKEALIFKVSPVFLDNVQIYELRRDKKQLGFCQLGDRFPMSTPCRRPDVVSGITLHPATTTLYLRVKTTSIMLVQSEILPLSLAQRSENFFHLFFGIDFGLLLAACFFAAYRLVNDKDALSLNFFCFQIVAILLFALRNGYVGFYLFPNMPLVVDRAFSLFSLFASLFGLLTYRAFLLTFPLNFYLKKILNLFAILFGLNITVYLTGFHLEAMRNNIILIIFCWILLLPLIYLVHRKENFISHSMFVLYFFILILFLVELCFMLLPQQGKSVPLWTLHSLSPQSLMSSVFIIILMQKRSIWMSETRRKLELDVALSKHQVMFEREQRQQQHALMAMLTHELKSPLSVIQMAIGSKRVQETYRLSPMSLEHIRKAVHDMNMLIEHCIEVDKLTQESAHRIKSQIILRSFIQQCLSLIEHKERIVVLCTVDPILLVDVHALQVILNNLLDNALKYALGNSQVHLVVYKQKIGEKEGILFIIQNLMIQNEKLDPLKIFEKYYRSSNAQRQRGTGLGLWIVKEFVRYIDGQVQCVIKEQIIEFHLWVPMHEYTR